MQLSKLVLFVCLLFLLTAWTCETEEDIYIYKVETWEVDNVGECECHIRMDDVNKGDDSITCFSITGDTLHYVVNY